MVGEVIVGSLTIWPESFSGECRTLEGVLFPRLFEHNRLFFIRKLSESHIFLTFFARLPLLSLICYLSCS